MQNKIFLLLVLTGLLHTAFAQSTAKQPIFEPQALEQQICQPQNIPSTTPSSRFIKMPGGPVVDRQTGLMWRTCIEGTSGEMCGDGKPIQAHWGEALQYPGKINADIGIDGYKDWRLPNVRELSTLIELQCANPAVNTEVFPNTPSSHVWTSSPYNFYTHYSWYVDFANGAPTYDLRTATKTIRLVRDVK